MIRLKKWQICLAVIYLAIIVEVRASDFYDYSFIHIDNAGGLSQSNVKSIEQDHYGFIWLGTKNGLNRYDGKQIKHFFVYDQEKQCGNQNVSALHEENDRTLWVGTDNGVYRYDHAKEKFNFLQQESSSGKQIRGWVNQILTDHQGQVWIVAPDDGIFRYHQGQLSSYHPITHGNKSDTPQHICICEDGEIWACSWYSGLFRYDKKSDSFEQITTDSRGRSLLGIEFNTISQRGDELILSVQRGALMKYNYKKNILQDIRLQNLGHTFVRNAAVYDGRIWAGTYDGLYILDEEKGLVKNIRQDLINPAGLSDDIIYTTFRDRQGGIWIGTMFGGVNYLPHRELSFKQHFMADNTDRKSLRIREIVEDDKGTLWIGTENTGICLMNLKDGIIVPYGAEQSMKSDRRVTLSMTHHDGNVFCGLFKNGMEIVHTDGSSTYLSPAKLKVQGSIHAHIVCDDGMHYVGTDRGIYRIAQNSKEFEFLPYSEGYWIFDLMQDDKGNIWAASMGRGVFRIDPQGHVRRYQHRQGDERSLSSNSVSSIMQDSKGNIWFSTDRGGICRFNEEDESFTRFSIEEGLPDNVAYKILEDDHGSFWFGTNQGLVHLFPESGELEVYTVNDGLCGNQFNYKSAVKGSDGRFYFGCIDGLISFDPNMIQSPSEKLQVHISGMYLHGKALEVGNPDSPLSKSMLETESITLLHNQTNIAFDIALPAHASADGGKYSYRLDPIDKQWIVSDLRQISYANLLPGKYTLMLRAAKSEEDDSATPIRQLQINVLPPWWKTSWAYLSYIMIMSALSGLWFVWYRKRKNRQLAEKQKLFEIEKEKELYQNKVTFFTEIAHEIRTPLTLIRGPLEIIQEMDIKDGKLAKNLSVIGQNTKRLLNLVSQLLDFQKIGADKLSPNYEIVNVSDLLTETVTRFEPTFIHNGKILTVEKFEENIMARIDREAITKIMSNIFNNALKYARQQAVISLKQEKDNFVLCVFSDNERIPDSQAEQIFEAFYQIDKNRQGVGIGLTMARSLALIHKGSLYLDPNRKDGNAFVLSIPLNMSDVVAGPISTPQEDWTLSEHLPSSDTAHSAHTVLIVEDDKDILSFMQERLSESFITECATNGQEALNILRQGNTDIVVSDVMMPLMNGFELCEAIKKDIDLCHIPVIFLTAKNDIDSKVHGLQVGAEAYIEKPFSFEYLKNQIISLLSNREKEREAFSKRPFFPVKNMQMSKEDEEFMNKVIQTINDNIADESFNVERMAETLCMSRSSLLRKIKPLFNMPPLDFIRLIRLKKAAELIQEGKYTVGEISFMVGFSSHSYFSKLFCRQFGIMPKDFERQVNEERQKTREHRGGIDIEEMMRKKQ